MCVVWVKDVAAIQIDKIQFLDFPVHESFHGYGDVSGLDLEVHPKVITWRFPFALYLLESSVVT